MVQSDGGMDMDLTNVMNSNYIGKLYFGAPISQGPAAITFDTGSEWLAVMSKNCSTCPNYQNEVNKYYNEELSMTAKSQKQLSFEQYGSAELTGVVVRDTVCIKPIDYSKELEDENKGMEIKQGDSFDFSNFNFDKQEKDEQKELD